MDIRPLPKVEFGPVPPLEIAWTYNARAGFGPDAPLLFEDIVLVATRQGELHVIDLATGKRGGTKRFGDAVNGSPAVIGRTVVVPIALGRRALAAYDLDASDIRWRARGASVHTGVTSVENGGVFVNVAGEVQRFDVAGGTVVWMHQLPEGMRVHAKPLVYDGLVIVAGDNGIVRALSLDDGTLRWSTEIYLPIYTAPVAHNNILVVSTTHGSLLSMNLDTGETIWSAELEDETVHFSSPAVDDEFVITGASDGVLRAFNIDTGSIEWIVQCPDALVAQPLIVGGTVYVGSMGSWFYAFDRASGELLQEIELRGRVKSAIGLASEGLIVLTEPRYVVRLSPVETDDEV
ncbi:MAG: PQQ-binding-like beta-propeller repeat protein [Bacteroidetes bacterium]|nr:PQQ-binding-like beta-propeller repeat protein [Bacteroidota bacterium]MDE2672227.1 PQQ-binding-like beta-propeller repeat protein [Bacteroidota bacterium]